MVTIYFKHTNIEKYNKRERERERERERANIKQNKLFEVVYIWGLLNLIFGTVVTLEYENHPSSYNLSVRKLIPFIYWTKLQNKYPIYQ